MYPLFKKTKQSPNVMGVDLGPDMIKIVEIQKDHDQAQLITFGLASHDHDNKPNNHTENREQLVDDLKLLIAQSHASTNRVIAALPALNVFSTIIRLPQMPKKELDSAIRWEAKRLVPLPFEKMSMDWHILSAKPSGGQNQEIMTEIILTAAPKDLIIEYLEIFKEAGLALQALETEITALRRSLVPQAGAHLIVDLGSTNTSLIIYASQIPVVNRNIDIGGATINLNIANSMNISPERAEQFRDDFGLPLPGQPAHPVSNAIKFVVDNMVIQEIKRLIKTFHESESVQLEKIIVTGGGARIKNLTAYLQNSLGLPTVLGNPWEKIEYNSELAPQLQSLAPQMAIAVGLALK